MATYRYPEPDPNPPEAYEEPLAACAMCGHAGLVEDDATPVEGDVMDRGCAFAHLAQLAEIVLGHDYREGTRVEAANRLDTELVTLKSLVRDLEAEVNRIKVREH